MCETKDLNVSPGLEIHSFIEQSGYYTNIGHEEKSIPVGPKGDEYAEMVSYQSLYAIHVTGFIFG